MSAEEIIAKRLAERRQGALEGVHKIFEQYLYLPDHLPLDATLATIVAHRMGGDPLWLLVVAPPSAGKTEIVGSLTDLHEVHRLSTLTAQTFASGLPGRKGARNTSLLNRLSDDGRSFLVLKDFTTVLSMHRDARAEVLGQLRELYDGSFTKEFGSGITVTWEGRLGFLAGVTPIIDAHHGVMATLGDRFVLVRLGSTDRITLLDHALEDRGSEAAMRRELAEAVASFIDGLDLGPGPGPLSAAERSHIIALADFVTRGRSGIERDRYTRDMLAVPEPEAPMRFGKQLAALLQGLEAIGYTEDMALATITRVAKDSLPPVRLKILDQVRTDPNVGTGDLARRIGLPTGTAHRAAEDLASLGLLHRWSEGEGKADRWSLTKVGDACPWWPANLTRNVDTRYESAGQTPLISSPTPPFGDFVEEVLSFGAPSSSQDFVPPDVRDAWDPGDEPDEEEEP